MSGPAASNDPKSNSSPSWPCPWSILSPQRYGSHEPLAGVWASSRSPYNKPVEIVKQLGLLVNHTGSDVRVITGKILGHKPASHASVTSPWWQWKQLFNVRWGSQFHINYLEMKMILFTLLWKCRSPQSIGKRCLHREDNMVCLLVLSKGRTSFQPLQPLCNKIDAVQLAMGSYLLHALVGSDEDPTDAASRL